MRGGAGHAGTTVRARRWEGLGVEKIACSAKPPYTRLVVLLLLAIVPPTLLEAKAEIDQEERVESKDHPVLH